MESSDQLASHTKAKDWIRFSLIAIAVTYAFFAGLRSAADFDLGWQIATGRFILQHHAIPSTEVFSYTAQGNPWIYPPLSGVIFYALFLAGGFAALSWLIAAACMAAVALIVRQGSRFAAALAIVAVPAIAFRTVPRAELFTTVIFTAFAMLLWRHYEGQRVRLWLLPLLMIAWVNLHTGFVAGLACMGAYVIVELSDALLPGRRTASIARLRQSAPWLSAAVLSTLVNPWGWRIYQAIERQNDMSQLHTEFIGEWSGVHFSSAVWRQALSFRDPANADWWILAAALIAVVIALLRLEIGQAIVLAVGAYAAVTHIRFQGDFAILVCVVGGSVLSRAWHSREASSEALEVKPVSSSAVQRNSTHRIAAWGMVAVFVVFAGVRVADLITDRYYLWSAQITLFGTGPSWWFPERAIAFLKDEHLPANLFGDYNLGGYLTWRAGPEYPDYFDGRFIPFGRDLFIRHETLVSLPLDSPEWESESSAHNVQTVIFSVARFGGLGNFPLQADCQSRTWTPVYLDDVAVIFVRNSPENESLVKRLGIRCETAAIEANSMAIQGSSWRASAERFQYLMNSASIEYVLSRDSEAADALAQAQLIFADDPNEHILKAQLAQAHGQEDIAEQEYRTAVRLRPTDGAWFALANLYVTEHKYSDAAHAVLESAALSQQSYERYRALGRLYAAMDKPQDALKAFAEARRRSPYHGAETAMGAEFDARIAEAEASAYRQEGDANHAVASQQESVRLTPGNAARWKILADLYQSTGQSDLAANARAKAAALQASSAASNGARPTPQQ